MASGLIQKLGLHVGIMGTISGKLSLWITCHSYWGQNWIHFTCIHIRKSVYKDSHSPQTLNIFSPFYSVFHSLN